MVIISMGCAQKNESRREILIPSKVLKQTNKATDD